MAVSVESEKRDNPIIRMFKYDLPIPNILKILSGFLIATMNGPTYFNYSMYTVFLFNTGAYKWLCPADAEIKENISNLPKYCDEQETAILSLSGIITGAQFTFSLLAGILVDAFPPKMIGFIGLLIQMIGYTILFQSSETLKLYSLGAALIGMGADISFFPLFSLTRYYPKRKATIISSAGTGRSIAFAMPILWSLVGKHLIKNQHMAYTLTQFILTCLSMTLMLLCVPGTPATDEPEQQLTQLTEKKSLLESFKDETKVLMKHVLSPAYLLVVPYAINNILRPVYLGTCVTQILQAKYLETFQFLGILSFLPCPVFGMAVDMFSIFPVMLTLNTCGVLTILVSLLSLSSPSSVYQWGFILFHNLAMSFILSQIYCYGNIVFPTEISGKLIGSISSICGLSLTIGVPLLVSLGAKYGSTGIFYGFFVSSGIAAAIVVLLWIQSKRKQQSKKFDI